MYLIRTAFWLSLLILVLPTDRQEQRVVYANAEAAVKDLSTFCARNPDVCEASKHAAHMFGEKAQFGAKMVMDFIQEKAGSGDHATGSTDPDRRPSRSSRSTLTKDDLHPAWSILSGRPGV